MTALPYAHLLKRQPSQERSVRRVEALLDAAAQLLAHNDPEAITIRDLADSAQIPAATIYQFFENKDTVIQALAVRYLHAMPAALDAVTAAPPATWEATMDLVVDGYAQMIRDNGAIRRLWLSGVLDQQTRRIERETDAGIASELGQLLTAQAGVTAGEPAQWEFLVTLTNQILVQAFTDDPHGDAVILREGRRAARAYIAAVLGIPTT